MLVTKITPDLSGAAGTGATPEPPRKDPRPRLLHKMCLSPPRWLESAQGTEQYLASAGCRAVRDQAHRDRPAVGPDAKGITWQQVRTAQNQLGWVAVKIGADSMVNTSAPAPAQVTSVVRGVNASPAGHGHPQPLTAGQLKLIGAAKLKRSGFDPA